MLGNHTPRRTRRAALLTIAALAGLLATGPAALGATRLVAPGGSAAGDCRGAPCANFAHAYGLSARGDVVQVAPGAYGPQTIPSGSKAVTFRGAGTAKVSELDNSADNVTFDGIDVDVNFAQNAGFENHGAANVTFKNGRIGNVTDEKGAVITGPNFTFDNVVFHDVRATGSSVHNECVFALDVDGMTVRNSLFHECATMDLFFTYGHWWNPKPPAYGNITLENNVFGHSTMPEADSWHYYSLYIGDTAGDGGSASGWTVRNNTFEIDANIETGGSNGTRWVGNVGDWTCPAGIAFRFNVGKKCSATDKAVNPASSTKATPAPFGWVNPAAQDFRLKQGSPAIGAADPADHPALDRDGLLRDDRPDAGAHEFGAGPPAGGPPITPTPPGSDSGVRSRISRRVICKRRRGCSKVALLRLSVSEPTRLAVHLQRLRKSHRPRTVRTMKLKVRKRATLRIRAGALHRGRYRVLVVTSSAGKRTVLDVLRLRVR